jgi:hypothetical protein
MSIKTNNPAFREAGFLVPIKDQVILRFLIFQLRFFHPSRASILFKSYSERIFGPFTIKGPVLFGKFGFLNLL